MTGSWSSPLSLRARRCCRASPSQRKRSQRPNLVHAERGSASLVAVAMIAVLVAITIGGVYVGSAVIARHRAQAAADLAALAAAVHLADGTACTKASAVARAMRTAVTQCVVEDLDVIVTVDAPLAVGRMDVGPARAAARAGPADTGS
ncbi:MAG: Rv3654c family TadE-like protein [Mycobacterium sp.]|uniref:Rv3654c family TadE-like protein n=1 Tax=Mycobacterium sp. TaxID=1785 RepID=UPI00389A1A2B